LQEPTLTAVCQVASVIKDEFVQYYSTFMPLAQQILTTARADDQKLLRGKAMESIAIHYTLY
jgi:hypothetical protein